MKAMILAAGYGTRLQPLTNNIPKALIEIKGIPLLEIIIKRLAKFGFKDIIINLHHFADQIKQFLNGKDNFGVNIQFSDETIQLLDTGGGILNAKWFFDDGQPFLVHNVDVLTDIDLEKLVSFHHKNRAMVTLAVKDRLTIRKLMFDSDMQLCEWINKSTGLKKKCRVPNGKTQLMAYSCVHVAEPKIFDLISEKGAFSIIDVYLRLAKNYNIKGFAHNSGQWYEMGKFKQVMEFNEKNDLDFLI
jgi:NDP-sugar pyrophosphorylase family protein